MVLDSIFNHHFLLFLPPLPLHPSFCFITQTILLLFLRIWSMIIIFAINILFYFAYFLSFFLSSNWCLRYWVQFIKANVQSFDILHENRTVCVINGSNNDNPKDLTCLSIDDFNKSWIFPKPEVTTHMNCRYSNNIYGWTELLIEFLFQNSIIKIENIILNSKFIFFFESDRHCALRLDHGKLVLCEHWKWFNRFM